MTGKCEACGKEGYCEKDHRISESLSPNLGEFMNLPGNLHLLCKSCHVKKSSIESRMRGGVLGEFEEFHSLAFPAVLPKEASHWQVDWLYAIGEFVEPEEA